MKQSPAEQIAVNSFSWSMFLIELWVLNKQDTFLHITSLFPDTHRNVCTHQSNLKEEKIQKY